MAVSGLFSVAYLHEFDTIAKLPPKNRQRDKVMTIEEAPFAENLQIHCRQCRKLIDVSIEGLRENSELHCSYCGFSFTPDIDVENLLKLMKKAEDSMLDSDLVM